MSTQRPPGAQRGPPARILDNAYALFSRRDVRSVGVNEIIELAAVAKATFYRHYPSKDALVLAFLAERERRWTFALVEAESRARGDGPLEQLLAIFDVFGAWFTGTGFEGCSFINVLLELGPEHPAGQASISHLRTIRRIVLGAGNADRVARPGPVRPLVPHPDERVDHQRRRRGHRCRSAGAAHGSPADHRAPPVATALAPPAAVSGGIRRGLR